MKKTGYSLVWASLLSLLCISTGFAPREGLPHTPLTPSTISVDSFPVPPSNDKILFYLQRTTNTNTIVYELNTEKDGSINKEEPIHAYWIRYMEDGRMAELNYIQRKFAYGLNHTLLDEAKQIYKLNFVSYEKKDIKLAYSARDKRYHAYLQVGQKNIELNRIYVRVEGGSFWLPNVPYIEIQGRDAATGQYVKEKIKP
jgi:hypothetical protein